MQILRDKRIVLGVCGGIAAYKAAELLRTLVKQGAEVRVLMTRNACEFVTPMTFQALSGMPVCVDLFDGRDKGAIRHIDWAREAHAVIVAPATANMIGKLANGVADDALSTFMLAVTAPRLVCPSMNTHMYENRAMQRNLDLLESDGYTLVEPDVGELACGTTGAGRLPDADYIVDRLVRALSPKDLDGLPVLVTAGPTREAIDPVRFISNQSSGKMGYAIARAAEHRGAEVTLISGPTRLKPPFCVNLIAVETAHKMQEAVLDHLDTSRVLIKVAAVADYRPKKTAGHKIKKKGDDSIHLELDQNPDILKAVGERKTRQIVVGFAAETQELEKNALKKLKAKKLDMIVGNLVKGPEGTFGKDTNQATFYYKDGRRDALPVMPKDELADTLLDSIVGLVNAAK